MHEYICHEYTNEKLFRLIKDYIIHYGLIKENIRAFVAIKKYSCIRGNFFIRLFVAIKNIRAFVAKFYLCIRGLIEKWYQTTLYLLYNLDNKFQPFPFYLLTYHLWQKAFRRFHTQKLHPLVVYNP